MGRRGPRPVIESKPYLELLAKYQKLFERLDGIEIHYAALCGLEADLRTRFADIPSWLQIEVQHVGASAYTTGKARYAPEFKHQVVTEYEAAPEGAKASVIRKYGLRAPTVGLWVRQSRRLTSTAPDETPAPVYLPPSSAVISTDPAIPVRRLSSADLEPLSWLDGREDPDDHT